MKRFLFHSLLMIVVVITTTQWTVSSPESSSLQSNTATSQVETGSTTGPEFITAHFGFGNNQESYHAPEHFRLHTAPIRVYPSSTNAFRIKNHTLKIYLQYLDGRYQSLRKAAFLQFSGYYLYFLRKLLI